MVLTGWNLECRQEGALGERWGEWGREEGDRRQGVWRTSGHSKEPGHCVWSHDTVLIMKKKVHGLTRSCSSVLPNGNQSRLLLLVSLGKRGPPELPEVADGHREIHPAGRQSAHRWGEGHGRYGAGQVPALSLTGVKTTPSQNKELFSSVEQILQNLITSRGHQPVRPFPSHTELCC